MYIINSYKTNYQDEKTLHSKIELKSTLSIYHNNEQFEIDAPSKDYIDVLLMTAHNIISIANITKMSSRDVMQIIQNIVDEHYQTSVSENTRYNDDDVIVNDEKSVTYFDDIMNKDVDESNYDTFNDTDN